MDVGEREIAEEIAKFIRESDDMEIDARTIIRVGTPSAAIRRASNRFLATVLYRGETATTEGEFEVEIVVRRREV